MGQTLIQFRELGSYLTGLISPVLSHYSVALCAEMKTKPFDGARGLLQEATSISSPSLSFYPDVPVSLMSYCVGIQSLHSATGIDGKRDENQGAETMASEQWTNRQDCSLPVDMACWHVYLEQGLGILTG